MAHHPVEWFLEQLEGVEGGDGQWQAWCPCHDDMGSSMKGLSITTSGKRVLMKCHSPHCGATLTEVLAVLQTGATSYNGNGHEPKITVKRSRARKDTASGGMAWWVDYTGVAETFWAGGGCQEYESGVMFTFEGRDVVKYRKPPKEIGWMPPKADCPPFWPMIPEELPDDVFITEGESDWGAASAAGHYAFAITKGAGTELPENWAVEMANRGARHITICGDLDKSGKELRREVEKAVVDAGMACSVVHLELVLDPFTGETDLRNLWKSVDYDVDEFNARLASATHQVSSRFPTLTYDELEEHAAMETEWLMTSLISKGDKVLISGPQKSYKTWIALDLVRSLVAGTNFLNRAEWQVHEPHNVLFVQEEGSRDAWAKRIRRLALEGAERERFKTLHRQGIRFTDTSTIDTVIAICRAENIDVLFLDPLQRMIPGVDENDSSATGVVWDEVFRIQFALPHLVVVVLHHANKTERLTWESVRGSSRHAGEVDLGIFCQKHPLEDNTVRISYDGRDIPNYLGTGESFEGKVKISPDEGPHFFQIDASEISVNVNTNPTHLQGKVNRDTVLNALTEPKTVKEIIEETGLSDSTVRNILQRFLEDKTIETGRKGKEKTYSLREESNGK